MSRAERTVEWGAPQIARAEGVSRQTAWRRLLEIRAEHPELVRAEGRQLLIRKSVYEARFARGATPLVGAAIARMQARLDAAVAAQEEADRRVDALVQDLSVKGQELTELRRRIEAIERAGRAARPPLVLRGPSGGIG